MQKQRPTTLRGARALLTLAGATLSAGMFAQTAPTAAAPVTSSPAAAAEDDIVVLSPFEVNAAKDTGYQATDTLAGSRINTSLADVGSSIAVVTAEFMKDTGATDNKTLLQYTANTEVGGVGGNFTGVSGGPSEDEGSKFTNPNSNTRVRGLTSADNTRNFFMSDAPWDGYNIDRVEIQRGPNSILFGLGSPAGIINTTTKVARFQDGGTFQFRLGSFGSHREVLDYNKVLLADELAIRVIALNNLEKYKQDPAFNDDRRLFATLRYDPAFLNRANGSIRTSLKLNYEKGNIKSNNPRSITPRDQITKWWDAMRQTGYNPTLVQNSGWFYDASGVPYRHPNSGQYNRTWSGNVPNYPGTSVPWTTAQAGRELPGAGAANPNYSPWLGASAFYGGVWLQVAPGGTSPYRATMPEFKNIGGRNTSGGIDGNLGTPPNARRVNVANTAYWAERATAAEGASYQSFGVWKAATLTDPSVFDFYNNLIDGDNKQEWQKFDYFNASLSQTYFNNKFGFEAAYDYQSTDRGQYSLDGAGVLYVDINTHNIDGSVNPYFGTPYIEGNGLYGNSVTDSTREAARLTAFFDHDFNKGGKGGFFRKLLGRHTITGLLSTEAWSSDSRTFARYGTKDSFVSLIANRGDAWHLGGNDRTVTQTIYLGDSLVGTPSSSGANIPRAGTAIQIPSTVDWRWFDSTWNAPSSVVPSALWVSTYDGGNSTQSENPANYVGWTTRPIEIVNATSEGGQDYLTREATYSERIVDSVAGSWQARFWDGAIVGLYGIRKDKVLAKALAGDRAGDYRRVDLNTYNFVNPNRSRIVIDEKTYSYSVVAKLNKIIPDRWLPINISLYYNRSDNFQVTGVRNDLYGNPLAPPTGETTDKGVMLSTKDGKYSLRVNKYESTVLNAGNSMINNNLWYLMGGDNFVTRLESRADAYQYRLKTRDDFRSITYLDDANPNDQGGWRWSYSQLTGETPEHATLTRMAAVAAWRDFAKQAPVQKILTAWGYPDLNQNPMTQTSQSNPTTLVANFQATEDQKSTGYEIEFTANPTKNWRLSFNAAESKAQRANVGGAALTEFTQYANTYHNKRFVSVSGPGEGVTAVADGLYRNGTPGTTYYFREATAAEIAADAANINSVLSGTVNTTFLGMGQFPTWGGSGVRNGTMVSWNSNYYSKYLLLKLQEGNNTPELRRWRFNFVSNYEFNSGMLKGFNVGLGYRWQDKVAIGYPVKEITGGSIQEIAYDIENPHYGPATDAVDLWIGYTRKITSTIEWNVQLNVRDVGAGNKLTPLTAQHDGTIAAWGIAPSQTWTLTNTFKF